MTSPDGDTELVQLRQHVPFTMVENTIIQSLGDYVALGLYLDMRSRPPGWRINLANLSRTKKQGRDSLTGAMNTLIENGLVFRVKFQQPTGRWATRIYVAQRPVTLDELLAVRESYSGRCTIVTSAALSDDANPHKATAARPETTATTSRSVAHTGISAAVSVANPLVGPTDGKPTLGEPQVGEPTAGQPALGQPDVGEPTAGNPALNYQKERTQTPPPTPSSHTSTHDRTRQQPRHHKASPDARLTPTEALTTKGEEDPEETSPKQTIGGTIRDPEANRGEGPGGDTAAASSAAFTADLARIDEVLEYVVAAWPQLGGRDLAKLAEPVSVALTAGLSVAELTEHLTRNTGGVRHPASVLLARCDNLPRPRPQTRPVPDWCGDCHGPNHRWIEVGPDHHPVRCARCNPQATRP